MSSTLLACVVGICALALAPATAMACHAQFNETWVQAGSVDWSGAGSDCVLEARLAAANDVTTLATVHYRRANPVAPLRISFRIDSPLAAWSAQSNMPVLRGTAAGVPADGPAAAILFELSLNGNLQGTQVRPGLLWACTEFADGRCVTLFPEVLQFPVRLTVELDSGEGSLGRLRLWVGDDTSGPPTGVVENIDNARWGGVERVSLGLFDVRGQLPGLLAGNPVVFDQITVSEPQLFWSDFETGAGIPVLANSPPVSSQQGSTTGDTCTGTDNLPVIASGSTRLYGPVNIHPLVVGEQITSVAMAASTPGARAFVCADPVSTTSACVAIGRFGQPVHPAAGRYVLVIGNVDRPATCVTYQLSTGPLTP